MIDHPCRFRRNETSFMTEVEKWYNKLLPSIVPLLYRNGGPIIAVQVEGGAESARVREVESVGEKCKRERA